MSGKNRKFSAYFILSIMALVGCQKQELKAIEGRSKDDIVRLGVDSDSFGVYKSSITNVADFNKQAWVNMPNSDANSKDAMGKLSELLVEVNCSQRSMRILKSTDKNGKDLELGMTTWDIPSPPDIFYPIVTHLCASK